jgi:hypothetical protein
MNSNDGNFRKLQNLWYALLRYVYKKTGVPMMVASRDFRIFAEYFCSVKNEDRSFTRELRSISYPESDFESLSCLLREILLYIKHEDIVDILEFENKYREITKKDLVGF